MNKKTSWLKELEHINWLETSGTSQKFFPHLLPGCKDERFVYMLKTVDSHCGRFPRAWLELPCASHYGVSRLMGLHYRSSHRSPFAIPAGQGELRQHYIARRKSVCIFEESQPSVPINGVVLRTTRDGISYSSDYKYAKTFIKLTGVNQNSKANDCD